jgi:Domain of unknown function (DUF4268)
MTAIIPLGHFDKARLRDAWPTEDGHFTPWLAQPENLKLLGEALGLGELQDQQIEVHVGDFRIDILAVDSEGDTVIIENQLEQTDHGHLGQLLTYLAGQEGNASLIWVAETFRDEHRAVIDWLNRNTGEGFSFFGVELELWRIGGSPPAPRFKLVAKPNLWSENVREAAREATDPELAERHRIRMAYWQSFATFLRERNSTFAIRRPIRTPIYRFPMGRPGFRIVARISIREQLAAVGLTISRDPDRSRYHALLADRAAIEVEFGETLAWDEKVGTKRSLISVVRTGINPSDSAQYADFHAWMFDRMERFKTVFASRLATFPTTPAVEELDESD